MPPSSEQEIDIISSSSNLPQQFTAFFLIVIKVIYNTHKTFSKQYSKLKVNLNSLKPPIFPSQKTTLIKFPVHPSRHIKYKEHKF